MRLSSPVVNLALARGDLVRLDAGRGVEVACDSGRVWITQERDPRDLWLTAGQSVRLGGRGLALLEADRQAHVRIARGA